MLPSQAGLSPSPARKRTLGEAAPVRFHSCAAAVEKAGAGRSEAGWSGWRQAAKRLLDVMVAGLLGILSLPVVALAAAVIRMTTGGTAFYSQWREGQGGRRFCLWKLRTMYPDAEERLERHLAESAAAREEWERTCKLRKDPRVIAGVGWVLRRTSVDELPQLWNVLRGDMSMVGPRPLPEYHLAKYSAGFRAMRHRVRPGLTGLWQVSGRSDGDLQRQQELDTAYLGEWSIWLDVRVLCRTMMAVVRGNGAY
ncbi:MAG: sugar transferase [Bryobacteraceae bacterium]